MNAEERLNNLKDHVSKLNEMLKEPQFGLVGWSMAYADHMKAITEYWTGMDEQERNIILEACRVALSDGEIYDGIAEQLDLSDDYLKNLQRKIVDQMS